MGSNNTLNLVEIIPHPPLFLFKGEETRTAQLALGGAATGTPHAGETS